MNYAKQYVNQPLQRVNRQQPCPVCGKTDWCSFNDRIAICMRVESNHLVPGKMGGWLHKLIETPSYYKPVETAATVAAKASAEVCDRVYRDFLSLLSLAPYHIKELSKHRGFTLEEIKEIGFKSLIEVKPWELCKRLIDMGYNLKGVPGFYQAPNKKGNGYYWCFNYSPGFIFPILDKEGKIQALQTRLDKPIGDRKYQLFSSGNKETGSSCGVPVHVAQPRILKDKRIWVTEGALKATILSQRVGAVVLGTVSSNTWAPVPELLEQSFPESEIVEAYDCDKYTNRHVKTACECFRHAITEAGMQLAEAIWNNQYKGVDDAVLARCEIRYKKIN
ncbi:toprim [Desulforamulus reducens MI-1]|uniref:Toprim n=2 Tax=Desulforamulus TaxID=2916693 RepID=A4J366_DESRM|nr:toprim [Desulforamulus reducens MI-1]